MSKRNLLLNEKLLEKCHIALQKQGLQGQNAIRLHAIISAHKYGISQVAKINNISRNTLSSWIGSFYRHGVSGFRVASGRGRKQMLASWQQEEMRQLVLCDRYTAKSIQSEVKIRYEINISIPTANRFIRKAYKSNQEN